VGLQWEWDFTAGRWVIGVGARWAIGEADRSVQLIGAEAVGEGIMAVGLDTAGTIRIAGTTAATIHIIRTAMRRIGLRLASEQLPL